MSGRLPNHDISQFCLNGHYITDSCERHPERMKKRCSTCGAKTITMCPNCGFALPGKDLTPSSVVFISARLPKPPAYCQECGAPLPWTQVNIDAAEELIREANLSEEEKRQMQQDIHDLVRDTPRAQVAVKRFKRLSEKAGGLLYGEIRSVIVDIASESVKKLLMG